MRSLEELGMWRFWDLGHGTKADSLQRNIPTFRVKPRMYLVGAGVLMAYGWYKLVLGIREAKYVPLTPPHTHPQNTNTTGLCPVGSSSDTEARALR